MRFSATILLDVAAAACLLIFISTIFAADTDVYNRIQKPVTESIDTRQITQEAETAWRIEKKKLATRFKDLQQEQAQLLKQKKKHCRSRTMQP